MNDENGRTNEKENWKEELFVDGLFSDEEELGLIYNAQDDRGMLGDAVIEKYVTLEEGFHH